MPAFTCLLPGALGPVLQLFLLKGVMNMTVRYWRTLLTIIAGGWLLLSPWVMNHHPLSYAA
jgi:hypothetical protein